MNLYLKITGAVLLVLSTTFCGFMLSVRLKSRCKFLLAFQDFLCTLETNIRYNTDDIIRLIEKSAINPMLSVFSGTKHSDFSNYWQKAITSIPQSYGLKNDDITVLENFGKALGTTDVEGQLNHIELYKNILNSQLIKSKEEYKEKSKLYKVLGFFTGSIIAIMFI